MKKLILSIALLLSVILVSAKNEVPKNVFKINSSDYVSNVNSFCKLIQKGDYNTVKTLIEEGEDVNRKSMGLTPLMYAARHNKSEIAKLLIKNGAKLKTKSDNRKFTALKWAEMSGAKDSYRLIKEAVESKKALKKRKKRQVV